MRNSDFQIGTQKPHEKQVVKFLFLNSYSIFFKKSNKMENSSK